MHPQNSPDLVPTDYLLLQIQKKRYGWPYHLAQDIPEVLGRGSQESRHGRARRLLQEVDGEVRQVYSDLGQVCGKMLENKIFYNFNLF